MKSKLTTFLLIVALAAFLRIYQLGTFPPGLYSDETSYGYNAYSLLKTGKDEYGKSWPLSFKSFGDYKPPMTAWLTIPSIALFGLNEFGVRLPSAIAGILTIIIVYFLANEIFPDRKLTIGKSTTFTVGEIASLLLAISPWHLQFSRSSMLVGIEAMFVSLGLWLFLKSLKNPHWLYLSAASFVAAIYTYYGSRVTVALLLIGLTIIFFRQLWQQRRTVLLAAFLGLILLSPLFIAIIKDPQTLTGRARTISIFYDPGIRAKLWQAHTLDGSSFPVFWGRLFHNKAYFYFRDISRRYFQHLSYDFWVRTGDTVPPFDIPNMGIVYLADIIFVFYGVYLAFRYRNGKTLSLLTYLFVSPIAASFTFITPASNRAFNMVIGWNILTALGIVQFINHFHAHKKQIITFFLLIGYLGLFGYYLFQYYVNIPQQIPYKWHYGRKELIQKVSLLENKYDRIVFSNKEGPAYIWLLFYKQYDPEKYRQTVLVDEQLNELGWLHIAAFYKYIFPREFDWNSIDKTIKTLYIGYEEQIPDHWEKVIESKKYSLIVDDIVLYPNGKTAFKLVHLETL